MQRLYTREDYLRRIEWMKKARRNISITTDIIVGFPGETEKDFSQTLSLLDEVEYDSLFGFKYSRRPIHRRSPGRPHSGEEKARRLVFCRKGSERSKSGGTRSWLAGSREAFVEVTIKPRVSGSDGLR